MSNHLIDNLIDSNNNEATEQILSILYAKAQASLDAHKQVVASMIAKTETNQE